MKKRIAILISGAGSNMVQLLDSLTADHPGRAVLVVSNVPGAGGLQKAEARGVATAVLDHRPFAGDRAAFEAELSKILAEYKPDMICQAGFMRILTADFVTPWVGRILNIHPSLLPKYKGLNTHKKVILNKEKFTGCTVHIVNSKLDSGKIILQRKIKVLIKDNEKTLAKRLLKIENIVYPKAIMKFISANL